VSRIQDILAKAERDGMTRRTQSESALTPAESLGAPVIAPVAGSAALDTTPFIDQARVTPGGPDKVRPTDYDFPTSFSAVKSLIGFRCNPVSVGCAMM